MSFDVLREYLALVLEVRTKKQKSQEFGDSRFDFRRFKALPADKQQRYAGEFLKELGRGSSRVAYLFSSRYALKIALNEKGTAQNDAELGVYTNPAVRPIVARIHAADTYRSAWLVSDLVKPLRSEAEFKQLSGTTFGEFVKNLRAHLQGQDAELDGMTKAAAAMARGNDLQFGDLKVIDHWGKTPDGHVVLLDSGFTTDVGVKHYSDTRPSDAPTKKAKNTAAMLSIKGQAGAAKTQGAGGPSGPASAESTRVIRKRAA